jgi:hypothetical protein
VKKGATKNQDLDGLDGIDHQGMQLKGEYESLQQVPEESVTERQIPDDQAHDSGVRSPADTQRIQYSAQKQKDAERGGGTNNRYAQSQDPHQAPSQQQSLADGKKRIRFASRGQSDQRSAKLPAQVSGGSGECPFFRNYRFKSDQMEDI